MIQKIKILTAMIISLFFVTVSIRYFFPLPDTIPVPHLSLKLVLNQADDHSLSLHSMEFLNKYPQAYKLTIFRNYDKVVIRDKNKSALYEGTFVNKNIHLPVPPPPGQSPGEPIEIPLKEIALFLPYYKSMYQIDFYNEAGVLLLSVNMNKSFTPTHSGFQNLCGNGICDFNENILSCFSDCHR